MRQCTCKGVNEHDSDPKFKKGEPEINISSHISLRASHNGSSNGNNVGGVFKRTEQSVEPYPKRMKVCCNDLIELNEDNELLVILF